MAVLKKFRSIHTVLVCRTRNSIISFIYSLQLRQLRRDRIKVVWRRHKKIKGFDRKNRLICERGFH